MSEEKESERAEIERNNLHGGQNLLKTHTQNIRSIRKQREQNFLKEQILSQTILDCFFGLKWAAFREQSSKKKRSQASVFQTIKLYSKFTEKKVSGNSTNK